jgi:hypothetical protein
VPPRIPTLRKSQNPPHLPRVDEEVIGCHHIGKRPSTPNSPHLLSKPPGFRDDLDDLIETIGRTDPVRPKHNIMGPILPNFIFTTVHYILLLSLLLFYPAEKGIPGRDFNVMMSRQQ